ncbi:MAG TPA: FG-GAP-like repeat-containing protein [Candidatus Eisenbacteria bacterium]|nr:FG-GAP-like repeat-containing protein [Candidatus Eisenbacteria bacterium]
MLSHRRFRIGLLAFALLLGVAAFSARPSFAQYMYLDTNGDGASSAADVIAPSGATSLDVWISTDKNRDGSAATCVSGDGPLTLNGYDILLRVVDGRVTWGAFVNARPEFGGIAGGYITDTDFRSGSLSGAALAPGTYKLATITVTPSSGTPSIVIPAPSSPGAEASSSFISTCSGTDFDNTLKLGTDWFDADGAAYGGTANQAPLFDIVAPIAMDEATSRTVPLRATDVDGEPLAFTLASGPAFASVLTTDPGTGVAAGALALTPGYADSGAYVASVTVADVFHSVAQAIPVSVANVNRSPIFNLVPMPMVGEGTVAEYAVSVVDADADALTLRIVSGPPYMTLLISNSNYGFISAALHFEPGYFDAGMTTATLGASDGVAGSAEILQDVEIMIRDQNRPPTLTAPDTLSVAEGEAVAFTASATDPDGQRVDLTATDLPDGATFVDGMNNRADFRWVPRYDQAGDYSVTLHADDLQGDDPVTRHLGIHVADVTAAVALAQPWDMRVLEGETAEATLLAFDADGSAVTFSLVTGPSFVTVGTTDAGAGTGYATGFVRATPSFGDSGHVGVTVAAGDGVAGAERTFQLEIVDVTPGVTPGGPPFTPPFPTLPTGQTPHTVTASDLNGDGHLDIVVAALNSNAVSAYLGAGDGTFGMRRDFATGKQPHTVVARDLNHDGIPDLSVTNVGANSVGTMLGLGDGTFGLRRDTPLGGSPLFVAVADFDRDGNPDYAITDQTNGQLLILRGHGDGTFEITQRYAAAAGSHGLAIADLNADGALDAVVANDAARLVTVHMGHGDGTFEPARAFAFGHPHTVSIGDLDEDGIPDLVVANFHDASVTICHGVGNGDFVEGATLPTGADCHAATIADVDADGHPDLIAVNQGPGTVSFLMGRGGGTLAPKVDLPVGLGAHSVITADINEDGALDVVLSSIFSNTVSLLANQNTTPVTIEARAFVGPEDQVTALPAKKPAMRVYLEPLAAPAPTFALEDLDPASVRLEFEAVAPGKSVAPVSVKRAVLADRDRNGVPEAAFDFSSVDVRALLEGVVGRAALEGALTGALQDGRRVRAPFHLTVVGLGRSGPSVTVAPNPMNPAGTVSFDLKRAGRASVMVVDVQGRLVARLFEEEHAAAGAHRIEFRPGARLASGIYFVRVETPDGVRSVRFAVLK